MLFITGVSSRRYAGWLGGALLGATAACAKRFVRRDEFLSASGARDSTTARAVDGVGVGGISLDHEAAVAGDSAARFADRWSPLAGCSLVALEEAEAAAAVSAAAAAAEQDAATRARLQALTVQAPYRP